MSHSPTSPNLQPPKSILRNSSSASSSAEATPHSLIDGTEKLDRKKVLENTRLNAQLLSNNNEDETEGDKIRRQIAQKRERQGSALGSDHLQWDEVNLYLTEQDKSSTMKIDEPKTPYEGGVDPNNDYYRSDNEDEDEDALEEFALGEPMENVSHPISESLNGGEIIKDENEEEEEEEPPRLSAEERHRKFEEMRKNHYHLKGEVLKHPIPIDDDDE